MWLSRRSQGSAAAEALPQPTAGAPETARSKAGNPLGEWTDFEFNRVLDLCAAKAAELPACAESVHGDLQQLLSLETADGHNAWYEAREADLSPPMGRDRATSGQPRVLDDFSADLDIAWSMATGLPQPVAPLCRYALMRTSARTLADQLSVPLLAAVVDKAIWPPETGLAYLRRLPDSVQAMAAMALAMWIPVEASKRFITEGRTLAAEERSVLDGCLLHAPGLYRPLLRQIYTSGDPSYRPGLVTEAARALAALAPSLPIATLEEAAQFLVQCGQSADWDPARASVAPLLAEAGRADKALAVADGISGHLTWIEAQDQVLARLDEQRRAEVMAIELEAVLSTEPGLQRIRRLSPLLSHLAEPERARAEAAAIREVLTLEAEDHRTEALIGLLPRLQDEVRNKAATPLLEMSRLPGWADKGWHWWAVRALAHVLAPAQVRELLAPLAEGLRFGLAPLSHVLAGLPDDLVADLAAGPLAPSAIAARLPPDMLATLVLAALDSADDNRTDPYDGKRAQAEFIQDVAAELKEETVRQAIASAAPTEGLASTRTDLLAELLPHLARLGHAQEALRAIGERLHGREAADALIRVAPYLAAEQLGEALDVMEKAVPKSDAYYRASALAGLAPFLDGPQLRRALSLSGALGDQKEMIEALSVYAETLALLGQVDDALAVLEGIPDAYHRAEAAAASTKHLADDERGPLLAAGMAACAAISSARDKAKALAELIPLYRPHQRGPALAALNETLAEVEEAHVRVGVLLDVADRLPEPESMPLLQQAASLILSSRGAEDLPPLTSAEERRMHRFRSWLARPATARFVEMILASWAVGDGRRGVESLAGFLARLPLAERIPLLDRATALAYTTRDATLRARILVILTPLYPSADRRIMVLAALDEALEHSDRERIDLLADLAARLPDEERPLVAARMVQAMTYRKDTEPRPLGKNGRAWTSLHMRNLVAPSPTGFASRLGRRLLHLLGLACPLRFPAFQRNTPPLDQGAATALYVFMLPNYDRDAASRAHAAAEVARRLPEHERSQLLSKALATAREARYPGQRSAALREIAALSPAAAQGPLVDEALDAARQAEREWRTSKHACLTELLPLLDPDHREAVAGEALAALLAEKHDPGMPSMLADNLTERVVRQALNDLEQTGDNTWRIARLLPRLAALGHAEEALARIATLPDASQAATTLAACTSHLPKPQVWEALRLAGDLERDPGSETDRAVALLLVRLAELGHPEEAIRRAKAELSRNRWMSTVVIVLREHVPETERAELALCALTAIRRLRPDSDDRDAIRELALDAMDAPRPSLLEWLQKTIHELSLGPRSALLHDLTDLGAMIVALDGGDALAEVARAARDVCRWWPADIDGLQPTSWQPSATEPGPVAALDTQAQSRRLRHWGMTRYSMPG